MTINSWMLFYISDRIEPEKWVLKVQDVSRFEAWLVDRGCDVDVVALPVEKQNLNGKVAPLDGLYRRHSPPITIIYLECFICQKENHTCRHIGTSSWRNHCNVCSWWRQQQHLLRRPESCTISYPWFAAQFHQELKNVNSKQQVMAWCKLGVSVLIGCLDWRTFEVNIIKAITIIPFHTLELFKELLGFELLHFSS